MPGSTSTPFAWETDTENTHPDYHDIARNMIQAKQRHDSSAPHQVDLAKAITNVQVIESIKQVNTLTVSISDPEWRILDSGFFDTNENGDLDPIDLNYPQGNRFWWRMTQVKPTGADHAMDLVFLPVCAVRAMGTFGAMKANRATMTRAEFLKELFRKVLGAKFYSRELDLRQTITAPTGTIVSARRLAARRELALGKVGIIPIHGSGGGTGGGGTGGSGSGGGFPSFPNPFNPNDPHHLRGPGSGHVGIGANTGGLTVKGAPINATQVHAANVLLSVAHSLGAPEVAMVAMIYASIWESGLGTLLGWDSTNPTYGGPLAGNQGEFSRYGTAGSDAVAAQEATSFMKGGRGYQSNGGIATSRVTSNPVEIATRVEAGGSYSGEAGYPGDGPAVAEAQRIVTAAGGGSISGPGAAKVVEPYYFDVGPHESYWAGATRLAQEVNWELFWDGNDVYYDSEQALIKRPPVAEIHRNDFPVADWSFQWDARAICTQFDLTLFDDMFNFHAGESFVLRGFGPGSTGSTAHPSKLPGRWLVQDRTRNRADLTTTYTLVQPDLPKNEPAPKIKSKSTATSTAGGSGRTAAGPIHNPFPGGTTGRLDMGVDGNSKVFAAPYNGTFKVLGTPGWPGEGTYCVVVNDDQSGPDYTRAMYFAEGMAPGLSNGAHVTAGQQIGTGVAAGGNGTPGNFEIGPASAAIGYDPLAKVYGLGSTGAREMITKFYNWLRAAGIGPTSDPGRAGNA